MGSFNDPKIREEMNILNAKVIESVTQWKHCVQRMENGVDSEENSNIQPQKEINTGRPQLRHRAQLALQEDATDHLWPNPLR
jgi:hypothetical protein